MSDKSFRETGIDRRDLLAAGCAAASLALASGPVFAAAAPVLKTTAGDLRGTANGTVSVFKGIPYATADRFMPPRPTEPWKGVRDATKLGNRSPQIPTAGIMQEEIVSLDTASVMSDDCLYLNLWTTGLGDGKKRPVMLWLHGGGFTQGSGGNVRYDGSNLASKHGVVLIAINHRLNAFGHLYLADIGGAKYADSGNCGVLDIVAALRWVRANAHAFGGDPDNVTIFGQSGGGGKVTTLMAMPPAKGVFQRAIAESGLALDALTPAEATETAKRLMDQLGLKPEQVDVLQTLPVEKIIAAMQGARGLRFGPVVDQRSLLTNPFTPAAPALSASVPLLLGNTLTEVTFMGGTPLDPVDEKGLQDLVKKNTSLDDAAAAKLIALYKTDFPDATPLRLYHIIASDNWLTANVALVAERKAALGAAPAYVYHFEKTTPVRDGKLGSPHTLEIPYVFDNLNVATVADVTGSGPERQALADKMSGAWTNFAKTGNPNAPGLPQWQPYTAAHRVVMIFNDQCKVVVDPRPEARLAIQSIHDHPANNGRT